MFVLNVITNPQVIKAYLHSTGQHKTWGKRNWDDFAI